MSFLFYAIYLFFKLTTEFFVFVIVLAKPYDAIITLLFLIHNALDRKLKFNLNRAVIYLLFIYVKENTWHY